MTARVTAAAQHSARAQASGQQHGRSSCWRQQYLTAAQASPRMPVLRSRARGEASSLRLLSPSPPHDSSSHTTQDHPRSFSPPHKLFTSIHQAHPAMRLSLFSFSVLLAASCCASAPLERRDPSTEPSGFTPTEPRDSSPASQDSSIRKTMAPLGSNGSYWFVAAKAGEDHALVRLVSRQLKRCHTAEPRARTDPRRHGKSRYRSQCRTVSAHARKREPQPDIRPQ